MSQTVLICGATGKQGGAVLNELVKQNADLEILAVTRNSSSASAQKLLNASPNIKLVQGDLADPGAIFKTAQSITKQPIWGVFGVQVPMGFGQGGGGEVGQGKALVDAALDAGVKFFVYTLVDRHGEDSENNPTPVPHFIAKHEIERHLIARATNTDMQWFILRPVAFMENLTNDFLGRSFVTAWKLAVKGKPVQFVTVTDVGVAGAQAFLRPEEYAGRAVSLAGNELTLEELQVIFKEKTGRDLPYTYNIVVYPMMAMVKELGYMFKWFKDEGFGADLNALRKEYSRLKTFGSWLATESEFSCK
ncbi:putative nucleoside-diphosphate-sugar epimerase family protein [Fusarium austroafricanum]|uniref:Putative nucleoside-diphosphate-sugar epimerase family protein n=1 Tax=Fusarium austroafricanum TaxID=2364996 RepID=A0A8H4KI98_9HYPO|nr:putative nucleoside-diphosphate-sugar epimerase family protein [Fusarium austroafricanum]